MRTIAIASSNLSIPVRRAKGRRILKNVAAPSKGTAPERSNATQTEDLFPASANSQTEKTRKTRKSRAPKATEDTPAETPDSGE